ncbi:type VI secretion system-associated protein TagO [Pseudocitrobacter faecalis]|uniref:type VI secretion system-associated protein TagO n=1 Tax=Pseudocitrobacter faecalis TaxID=1398493 RepID=UPI003B9E65FA
MKLESILIGVAFTMGAASSVVADADVKNVGSWVIHKDSNKLTDATDVVVMNYSKDSYSKDGMRRSATLVLRCMNSKTDVFLSFDDYLGIDDPKITVRFDDAKAVSSRWAGGEGGDSAFSPQPIKFLKAMASHKKVIFGFEPYGSVTQVAEFDLSLSDEALQEVSKSCNWKLSVQ